MMVEVRAFTAADYEAVLALDVAEQRAYRGSHWDVASEDEREGFLMTSPRNVAKYEASDYCFVAVIGGEVIGFLFALALLRDGLVVDGVGVQQGLRRQGIGRRLYGELVERARERGVRRIQALISVDNVASIALHESAGFALRDRKEALLEL